MTNNDSLGLYIHVPFCIKKCRYCDFISYPYNSTLAESYVQALEQELYLYSKLLEPRPKYLTSIFVGGGTPTCLPTKELTGILTAVRQFFDFCSETEFTVEANPGTIDDEKLFALYEAGVNRLSLGVQACKPRLLNLLGRIHSFDQAVEAVERARRLGFYNLNLDLIFGVPGQSQEDWQYCLQRVIDLSPEHLSLYGLQLEEKTPLWQEVEQGQLVPCPEEDELAMYLNARKFLKAAGFKQYEISNFALVGKCCRHNLRYWNNKEYLGVGPGAHSYIDKVRFANTGNLNAYIGKLKTGILPVESREIITPEIEMSETVFLALRLVTGLDLETFEQHFGVRAENKYQKQIEKLAALGLIQIAGNHLHLTEKGLPLANLVFREFV